MEKRSNKYYLTLSLKEYANGATEPAKELGIQFDNHDEIYSIIERIKDKNIFEDVSLTIADALREVHAKHPQKTRIAETSFGIALNKLG